MISLIILGIIFLYAIISYNTLYSNTRNTKKRRLLKSQIYGRRATTPSQLKKKQILTKHSRLLKIISLW